VLPDIQALGLMVTQGLIFTEAFYWDLDEGTRQFSSRFAKRFGRPPTSLQAGAYSATLHYLKAVAASNSTAGPEVVARMKAIPVSDEAFGQARVREDGRMVHDMVLVQVKKPGEAKGEWDLYDVLRRIPGAEAFRPASKVCSLVK
jgi:branched-chain amino acid transport system substrate-binding protein